MSRTDVHLKVNILTDSLPGVFYESSDVAERVQGILNQVMGHYLPVVQLVDTTIIEVIYQQDGSIARGR